MPSGIRKVVDCDSCYGAADQQRSLRVKRKLCNLSESKLDVVVPVSLVVDIILIKNSPTHWSELVRNAKNVMILRLTKLFNVFLCDFNHGCLRRVLRRLWAE